MLHVGIVVKDLDKAVERWKAIGFTDIRVLPPNAGVDRMYHGKPLNATLKQAFIHGTTPLIELMEPPADVSSPWGDYLKEHGEALHHLAYRIPDTGPELEKFKKLGIEELAQGKWPEGKDRWGTFHYVQEPGGGVILEFISQDLPRGSNRNAWRGQDSQVKAQEDLNIIYRLTLRIACRPMPRWLNA